MAALPPLRTAAPVPAFVVLVLAALAASPAEAQSLLVSGPLDELRGAGSVSEHQLDIAGLEGLERVERIQLVLPDGVFEARRVRATPQARGAYWEGVLHEAWPVLLTLHRGHLSGLIHTPWSEYEVFPGPVPGRGRLATLESERFPGCATGLDGEIVPAAASPAAPSITTPPTALAPYGVTAPVIMDALVVYTSQARAGAGGQSQVEATIQSAVNITNTAYVNSQVEALLHLMHMEEAPFEDSGSSGTDLTTVRTSTVVAALRDRYGADLVGLIVNRNDACGRGYLQRSPGAGFANFAYQVTTRSCAVGNLSFAHEFGHNQGCEHDPANGNSPSRASFPYAFGHFHSGAYRTVMSYSNQCTGGCRRAPYFSNSNVTNQGRDTGILDQRENYRVINQTSGIVADFRPPASPIDFSQGSWPVREDAGAIDVTLERSGLTDGGGTIFVRPISDSATVREDFPAFTATVTWAPGDATSKTVRVPIIDDRLSEGPERFELALESGRGIGAGTVGVAEILIDDIEEGFVRLVVPSDAVENRSTVAVRVERFDGSSGDVSVDWSLVDDTATAGEDYVAASGTLRWTSGDARAQLIEVDLLDDDRVEGEERFTVLLTGAAGGLRVATPSVPVVIRDYEEGRFSFALTATAAREDAGFLFLPVTRELGSDGEVEIAIAFGESSAGPPSATRDEDFAVRLPSFVVPRGVTTWTVPIELRDDVILEGPERFTVTLDSATNGGRIGDRPTITIDLQDWEEGRADIVENELVIGEDETAAVVSVTRTNGSDGEASLRYRAVPGSAAETLDFEATEGELRWAEGDTETKTITVPLLDDDLEEGDETFAIRLDRFLDLNAGARTEVQVTLLDREAGAIGLGPDVRVSETEGGEVTVLRTGGSTGEVSASYRWIAGTAALGEDVIAAEGIVVFADGDVAPKAIPIDPVDDDLREDEESLTLELSAPTNEARIGPEGTVTVTIVDAGAGNLTYAGPVSAPEKDGAVVFTFERTGEAYGPLTLSYALAPPGPRARADAADVETSMGTLSWGPDETGIREARIPIVDDELDEGDEVLRLRFDASDPTARLSVSEVEIAIIDDDGGCGCTAAERGGPPPVAWLLLMGLALLRRRPRRA